MSKTARIIVLAVVPFYAFSNDQEPTVFGRDTTYSYVENYHVVGVFTVLLSATLVWGRSNRRKYLLLKAKLGKESQLREVAQSKIHYFANLEPATELPRRHHFIDIVNNEIRMLGGRQSHYNVYVVDFHNLTHFANEARDAVFSCFSEKIKSSNIVAGHSSLNGFALFSKHAHFNHLIQQVVNDLKADNIDILPFLRIGWSPFNLNTKEAGEALRIAENKLELGTRSSTYWHPHGASVRIKEDDLRLIVDFIDANVRNLYCVYQPQVDIRNNEVVGAEALVRWNHPELGLIYPDRFIPVFEQAGLISQVATFVIDNAVRVSKVLRRSNLPSRISVNVSPRDFTMIDLVESVDSSVTRRQGRFSDLVLELTETCYPDAEDIIKNSLRKLRELGVHSSIDDFGTGYSSLSHVSTFPVSEVKIDKMFINSLADNQKHVSIVRSTIALAHELELTIIAEGVEDQKSYNILGQMGCDMVQGYYISKPLEEEAFLNLLASTVKEASADTPPEHYQ